MIWFVSAFYNFIVVFYEAVNGTFPTPLCKLLMMISEYYNLIIDKSRGNAMTNILFRNYSYFYFPSKEREPKQKNIETIAD